MIRPSARSGRRRQRGGTKSFPFPPDNRFRYEPKTDRMPKKISPFRSLLLCAALSLTGQAPAQPGPTPGLTFEQPGSAERFTAVNGSVATRDGALEYTFRERFFAQLAAARGQPAPALQSDARKTQHGTPADGEPRVPPTRLRLRFITDRDSTYDEAKSKIFEIEPNSPKKTCYLNLSDNPHAKGRLKGFRIEPLGGKGMLRIDRITFEQEAALEPQAGRIDGCTATPHEIAVTGSIDPKYRNRYSRIAIYRNFDATTRRRYRPDDRIVRRRTDSGIPHRRHPDAQWRHDAAEQPVPGGRQRRQRQFSKDRAALLHRQLERFRRESLRFRIAFAHGSRYRLRSQGRRIHRRYRRHPGGDRRRCREGGRTGRARRRRLVLRQTLCRDQHPAEKQHRTAHRRRRDPLAVAGRARLQV